MPVSKVFPTEVLEACRLSIHPYLRPLLQGSELTYDYDAMEQANLVAKRKLQRFMSKHGSAVSHLMVRERNRHVLWTVREVAAKLSSYLEDSELGKLLKRATVQDGSKLILGVNMLPQLYLSLHPEFGLFVGISPNRLKSAFSSPHPKLDLSGGTPLNRLKSALSDTKTLRAAKDAGLVKQRVKTSQIPGLIPRSVNTIVEDKRGSVLLKDFDNALKMIAYASSQSFGFHPVRMQDLDVWIRRAKNRIRPNESAKAQSHFEKIVDGIYRVARLRSSASTFADRNELNAKFSQLSFYLTFDPVNVHFLDTNFGIIHTNDGLSNAYETRQILREVQDKGRKPDLMDIALSSFVNPVAEKIAEDYMLLGLHKNSTLQVVTKDQRRGVPRYAQVVEDSRQAAGWSYIQNRILQRAGAAKRVVAHVDGYREALEYYRKDKINFGLLRNPSGFFVECLQLGFRVADTGLIKSQTKLRFAPTLGYAAILARKDTFHEQPDLLDFTSSKLSDACEVFETNPYPFIVNNEAGDFHRYLLHMAETSKSEVEEAIDQRVLDLKFT
jgi:hypothetical protein